MNICVFEINRQSIYIIMGMSRLVYLKKLEINIHNNVGDWCFWNKLEINTYYNMIDSNKLQIYTHNNVKIDVFERN